MLRFIRHLVLKFWYGDFMYSIKKVYYPIKAKYKVIVGDLKAGWRDGKAGVIDHWYKNHREDNGKLYFKAWDKAYNLHGEKINLHDQLLINRAEHSNESTIWELREECRTKEAREILDRLFHDEYYREKCRIDAY